MMFAQANSEHCRHKIFNARWTIDGEAQPHSLFAMIRNTTERSPGDVLSAYKDNAAVIRGSEGYRFYPIPGTGAYGRHDEDIHILMKVETHNHPTAISPDPGAATGAGGEIRDEGATGVGAKPKAGLCGFSVSTCASRAGSHGKRTSASRADRQRARHHARRPDRWRRVQQRVRPSQPARLLPYLRRKKRARGAG